MEALLKTFGGLFNHFWLGAFFGAIALFISFFVIKPFKKWLLLWGSFGLMQASIWILKFWVGRPRPEAGLFLGNPSFPSGVAADAAFVAIVASVLYPKYRLLWIVISIFIVFLRGYIGVHYISDLLGGYLIGLLFGFGFKVLQSFEMKLC